MRSNRPPTTNFDWHGIGLSNRQWQLVREFVHKTKGTKCVSCGQPTETVRHETQQRLRHDWHIDSLVPRCCVDGCSPMRPSWSLKQHVYDKFIRPPVTKLEGFESESGHPWRYSNQANRK